MRRLLYLAALSMAATLLFAPAGLAQQAGGTVTDSFELTVEGQPPANATFFGLTAGVGEGSVYVQLTDPDGDGLYTGSATVTEIQSDLTPIAILQGTGTVPCADGSGACPGDPITLLKDFGLVEPGRGDQTFAASVSFTEQPAAGQQYAAQATVEVQALPDTSGPSLLLPTAGLLLVTGLIGMRLMRRS